MKKTCFGVLIFLSALSLTAEARMTYDLGYSIGSTNGESYSEGNLGLNLFFTDWLIWRNSLFGRFYGNNEIDDVYGLDTSARFNKTFQMADSSYLNFFGGPGWRFASQGESPPFVEGGLNVRIGGLNVGGGAKVIFNKLANSDATNDTLYFINLSGSGSIGEKE